MAYQVKWMADDVSVNEINDLSMEDAKIACIDGQLQKDVNFVFMAVGSTPIFRAYKIGDAWRTVS